MAITLTQGLSDLSKELNETNVNTAQARISHYNDAVIEFFGERKWPFAIKKDNTLTTSSGDQAYSITHLTDMRGPGGIKEVFITETGKPFTPIDYGDRHNDAYSGKSYFYEDPEQGTITFTNDITTDGDPITIYYYHIPARIESTASLSTFPIPDRYRKAVATLAASFVQRSRYLEGPANSLFNLYERMIGKITLQQSERTSNGPRKFPTFLQWRGFRRTRSY